MPIASSPAENKDSGDSIECRRFQNNSKDANTKSKWNQTGVVIVRFREVNNLVWGPSGISLIENNATRRLPAQYDSSPDTGLYLVAGCRWCGPPRVQSTDVDMWMMYDQRPTAAPPVSTDKMTALSAWQVAAHPRRPTKRARTHTQWLLGEHQ